VKKEVIQMMGISLPKPSITKMKVVQSFKSNANIMVTFNDRFNA